MSINEVEIKEYSPEEYERALNDYQSYMNTFVEGFFSDMFSKGIIDEVDMETLKKYFANPDDHQKEIENLAQYYYISSAEVHQLFELVESLPTLNYKIDAFDKGKSFDKNISVCNKILHKVKHKTLTRDILKQEITAGTLVGMWLGDKTKPYPYIFDNLNYIFPAYRKNGEWQVTVDLNWFKEMTDLNRKMQIRNLSPHITEQDYDDFLKDPTENQYVELPQDRTFVLRTHTLKRNQNLGNSWVTVGLYDVLHKKKLKDVERSIANKIINAIAVLTIGSDKNDDERNTKLPPQLKKKVHSGVKAAMEKNESNGITVVAIPNYAKIEFPDVKTDGLDGKKFDHINSDIQSAYGIGGAALNGTGGNHATAKINIDTFYKRVAVLLESIEQEVYGKLFNLVLPKNQQDNYMMIYDKEAPLSLKDKVDYLIKLNDKGWSIKHVVDHLDGISWESYLEQTLYETEDLELQSKIVPYKSTHTTSSSDEVGRPTDDSSTNDNTIKSKTTDGNSLPD
ncbi:hypothetical protein [Metabacillus arenae]|uniref:Portal protein n=1 Tax=Metabacillus arenae TaxID=2771434 RepID=A0A926NJW6_9BACI|nr:hypothetical protein [Metabacillus arenae]MBD1379206.1 hypothetical protein [Metabacillus arenae]